MLKLAEDLKLPLDVVTQTIAILAKRRAGKSYTMRRLVEQLHHAGQQIVLVDPKGDQWGIRSAADGKGPGLPIVILGGEHADVPLEPGTGAIIAKLVVEERVSVVIDLSGFRKGEVARFMGGPSPPRPGEEGFLEALYRLKAREQFRTPVMLVIDEADAIAPQKAQSGEERMLGAAEDLVRRGGQRGIGCVFVSQRSAVLNKNVLTQAQILVALRTIAPQDLQAMKAWIDVHGTVEQRNTLMESLPALPIGDAWFWSPGWPTTEGIFKRVHVLQIETFDSGASPKPGETRREPKTVADVDLEALKRQMAATIEKAKADDPRELRKQIADLRKQLGSKLEAAQEQPTPKVIEKHVLKDGQLARAEQLVSRIEGIIKAEVDRLDALWASAGARLDPAFDGLHKVAEGIVAAITKTRQPTPAVPRHTHVATAVQDRRSGVRPDARIVRPAPTGSHTDAVKRGPVSTDNALLVDDFHDRLRVQHSPKMQQILDSLAELEQLGARTPKRTLVAFLSGYSNLTSKGFVNALSRLSALGFVTYPGPGRVKASPVLFLEA